MSVEPVPETIVFDAEPLIAYFADEAGSDTVERYLEAVERGADGFYSAVTLTEVHYVVRAFASERRADTVVDVLDESGLRRVDTADTWRRAADFKARNSLSLGDAFALATTASVDGTLLAGADVDFDQIVDLSIERFRTSGV